jgi:hypothetical protein
VDVTGEPVYLEAESAEALREALREAGSVVLGARRLIVDGHVDVAPDGQKGIVLTLFNNFQDAQSGEITLGDLPAGVSVAAPTQRFHVAPSGSTEVRFVARTMPAVLRRAATPWTVRCANGQTLEGTVTLSAILARKVQGLHLARPDEWAKLPTADVNLREQISDGDPAAWGGPDDCSAQLRAAWDAEFLYLVIDVRDDHYLPPIQPNGAADAVELFLSTDLAKGITENFYQLFLAAQTDAGAGFAYVPKDSIQGMVGVATVDGTAIRIAVKIPLARLKIKPSVGTAIGFDYSLNDGDKARSKRERQMPWTGTVNNWRSTADLGRLILDK